MSDQNPPQLLFAIYFNCCITTPGLFFLCGTPTYLCVPTNWTRTCTLVYSRPNILIAPKDQPLPIPLIHKRIKWAIHFIPLLIGLRIVAAIGIGLTTSIQNYQTLSKDLSDSCQEIVQGLITVQYQVDSLVAVILQNRRGLYLLTAEKGGLCLSRWILLFLCQPVGHCPRNCKKPYRSSLMNPPERKQLLAVMADRLELDALDFIPSWTIYFYHLPTHLWVLFV